MLLSGTERNAQYVFPHGIHGTGKSGKKRAAWIRNEPMNQENIKKRPVFFVPVEPRFADTDANAHVYFGNYLTYFDMALLEYFKAVGFSFSWFVENGMNIYYAEALTRFRASAVYGDILHVHAGVSSFGNTSFTSNFLIFDKKTDRFLNSGHIVSVVINNKTGKPIPVPREFKNAVIKFERDEIR